MVIVNQSTEHPNCPVQPKNQRVNDYWSYMVIKPITTFRKNGLEFVVTYFDNPGIVMPATVKKWVSRIYMPDFLNKLHQATIRYASAKDLSLARDERFNDDAEEDVGLDYFWERCPDPGFEYPPERMLDLSVHYELGPSSGGDKELQGKSCDKSPLDKVQSESADQQERNDEEAETEDKTGEGKRNSWWSYLHPYSYFA